MISQKKTSSQSISEVNKLIRSDENFPIYGNQINTIFYALDQKGKISYLNEKARKWLNLDLYLNEDYQNIDIESYFEDKIAYIEYKDPDESKDKNTVKYNLQKVWFPTDLDFKLCLISTYSDADNPDLYCSIVPLQDWKYLKNKLVDLIEEEEFIMANKEKYDRLTKREKEVVGLISVGLNSREISSRLFISKHTVEQHRKNAKRKLGISTTADLLKFGRVFGSID